jgi:branched-chain amino acid transport system substrate-binding protein
MIVLEETCEVSEPTIDSHIVKLKSTGADVHQHHNAELRRRRSRRTRISWKPVHFTPATSRPRQQRRKPAGFENAQTSSPRGIWTRRMRSGRTMPG